MNPANPPCTPVEIELKDTIPGMVILPIELPPVEISEDFTL